MLKVYDVCNQRAVIQFIDEVRRRLPFRVYVVQTDNGAEFQSDFHWHLERLDIRHVYIRPRSPHLNPFVERLIGTLRRKCFDHVIVWNERSLRRTLARFLDYYHEWRPHLSLEKDAPFPRPMQPPAAGTIVEVPHLGGLQHHYERRAA